MVWLAAACQPSPPPPATWQDSPTDQPKAAPRQAIWVVKQAWHAGVVVPRQVLAADTPGLPGRLGPGRWVEAGWGDRRYYPDPEAGSGVLLGAVARPGPAVMHMAAFDGRPAQVFAGQRVVRLAVTPTQQARAAEAIAASLRRPADAPLARGLYLDGRFYPARGGYHLMNNCNSWAARVLAAAGCRPAPPRRQLFVGDVLDAAEACGGTQVSASAAK